MTGGSEGLGRSVSIELSRLGANVVIVARNVEKLQAALENVKVFRIKAAKDKESHAEFPFSLLL